MKKPPQEEKPRPGISFLNFIARLLPGALLVWAGFYKATGPVGEFAGAIEAYQVVSVGIALKIAAFFPWVEIYVGLFLIAGAFLKWTRIAAASLFGGFTVLLGLTLLRGINPASCGCFGEALPLSPGQTLIMDIFLLALLLFTLWKPASCLSIDNWVSKGQE